MTRSPGRGSAVRGSAVRGTAGRGTAGRGARGALEAEPALVAVAVAAAVADGAGEPLELGPDERAGLAFGSTLVCTSDERSSFENSARAEQPFALGPYIFLLVAAA